MTRTAMRGRNARTAIAGLALLYAVAALAILATASTRGDRSTLDRTIEARALDHGPLGR